MGLFTRKVASRKVASTEEIPQDTAVSGTWKPFRIELGWRGMLSLLLVFFCLFFWMFMLGLWAGQTILFPQREARAISTTAPERSLSVPDHTGPAR